MLRTIFINFARTLNVAFASFNKKIKVFEEKILKLENEVKSQNAESEKIIKILEERILKLENIAKSQKRTCQCKGTKNA